MKNTGQEKKRTQQNKKKHTVQVERPSGRAERHARAFNRASGQVHQTVTSALSYLRLSLTYRIAVHYAVQLLRSTIPVMLVFSLVFFTVNALGIQNTMTRVILAMGDGVPVDHTVLQNGSATVSYSEEGIRRDPETGAIDFWGTALSRQLTRTPFPLVLAVEEESTGQVVTVTFLLRERIILLLYLLAALAACDLLRVAYFIRHRNRIYRRVLAPIRDITEMAATLSANNLSNRINIAGTKNELKDLAAVINSMLDRIELSYNSQKQFVSDASHELRTPIAVIQGYADMLKRWGKDDPTVLQEGLDAISQETASMKELVESLLFLARHDKKTLLMEIETFSPREVLQELHREAAMVAPEDIFALSHLEEGQMEGDRSMVKQVLRILLDNAVKYTPKGGTITMGVQHVDNHFIFTVQDTGPGIAAQEVPKIFDRFYRAEGARKAQASGHGLGLSIARIIVMSHGGKIQVRSKVGTGTAFLITMPERHLIAPPQESAQDTPQPTGRRKKATRAGKPSQVA